MREHPVNFAGIQKLISEKNYQAKKVGAQLVLKTQIS